MAEKFMGLGMSNEELLKMVYELESENESLRDEVARLRALRQSVGRKKKRTPAIIAKVKNLRESGLTYQEIARALNLSVGTVYTASLEDCAE
jgi:DNA invertase Pin-like site-specific DNA recombinase